MPWRVVLSPVFTPPPQLAHGQGQCARRPRFASFFASFFICGIFEGAFLSETVDSRVKKHFFDLRAPTARHGAQGNELCAREDALPGQSDGPCMRARYTPSTCSGT